MIFKRHRRWHLPEDSVKTNSFFSYINLNFFASTPSLATKSTRTACNVAVLIFTTCSRRLPHEFCVMNIRGVISSLKKCGRDTPLAYELNQTGFRPFPSRNYNFPLSIRSTFISRTETEWQQKTVKLMMPASHIQFQRLNLWNSGNHHQRHEWIRSLLHLQLRHYCLCQHHQFAGACTISRNTNTLAQRSYIKPNRNTKQKINEKQTFHENAF